MAVIVLQGSGPALPDEKAGRVLPQLPVIVQVDGQREKGSGFASLRGIRDAFERGRAE